MTISAGQPRHARAIRAFFVLLLLWVPLGFAQQPGDPAARVKSFYAALLETMKEARKLGVEGRYKKLAPAIGAAFDLAAMTRIAVGPTWTSLTPEQQSAITTAFTRLTVANYASRFDGYEGERFEVDPTVTERGADRVVNTRLVPKNGEPVVLNYLMRNSGGEWKIVDVYLSGTISELSTRRTEFASLLKSGGPDLLVRTLRARADKLLNS
jgi:phospholipid transport system substrate-binding protein